LIGQVKWEAQLVSLQPLNLNNLPSGIYFYRLKNGEAVTSGKIVKR